jgi:flagellar basal-body rod protein FlgC
MNTASFLPHLTIPVSGMSAQRLRMEVISHNITNAATTMTESGEPFRRQLTLFGEVRGFKNVQARQRNRPFGEILNMTLEQRRELNTNRGVQVFAVVKDEETPFTPVYDPAHPHANEEGYVMMPNVDVAQETMDMMAAQVSFLNNVAVFDTLTNLANRALSMGSR